VRAAACAASVNARRAVVLPARRNAYDGITVEHASHVLDTLDATLPVRRDRQPELVAYGVPAPRARSNRAMVCRRRSAWSTTGAG